MKTMSILIGIVTGLYGGLFGVGGGFIMIPLMVELLKVKQHSAHGTSLAVMVFVGIVGAGTYASKGSIDLLASALLAITAVITAYLGAHYANGLPEWRLKRSFGIFLVLISGFLFLKPFLPSFAHFTDGWGKILVLLTAGVIAGFLSGMLGVGGAIIMIPAMVLLVGLDQHTAQGSSLLTMVPAGIAGAWAHKRFGSIETPLLRGLIPGVFVGTYLGGRIAHSLPEGMLRFIFSLIVVWTALRYLKTPIIETRSLPDP